jgi:hypothetical protein
MRIVGALAILASSLGGCHTASPTPRAQPIFVFSTDEMWLNMHHFLYVLARAELGQPDANRESVIQAPADASSALQGATEQERRTWREAVSFYTGGMGGKDLVFDQRLAATTIALAAAADSPSLDGAAIDSATRRVLEGAAPVYRKYWWAAHRKANGEWVRVTQPALDSYGHRVLDYIVKAYALPWPKNGYPVHMSGYTNWAGAYSTMGNLLVVSSLASNLRGAHGVEIVFHESMHQWDDSMQARLRVQARRQDRPLPRDLSHAMIFYTTGEAMKSVLPGHTPLAEIAGIWDRGMGRYRDALRNEWQPYLDGRIGLDSALFRLIAASPRG